MGLVSSEVEVVFVMSVARLCCADTGPSTSAAPEPTAGPSRLLPVMSVRNSQEQLDTSFGHLQMVLHDLRIATRDLHSVTPRTVIVVQAHTLANKQL